ncbi:MAG: ABC transporter substrate-binding protein [Chloroflexi bacterium]|nr:ABC transporter substrate-binding protein [Chloroflexota bacterium]
MPIATRAAFASRKGGVRMNYYWKRAIACFLVLAMISMLCLSCNGGKDEEKVTITIGQITDLTGAGAPALQPLHYGILDLAAYYNENDLIPGVKIKIASYNNQLDPSKDIPGYDWVKGRGAQLVIAVLPQTAEILRPFAERDGVPLVSLTVTETLIEPPGWVFCFSPPLARGMCGLLGWVAQNDADFPTGRPAKIGFTAWSEPTGKSIMEAMKGYCQSHSDKFEWKGDFMVPVGSVFFGGEADKLKDCDYVASWGYSIGPFLKEYRAKGYKGKLLDLNCTLMYEKLLKDSCGWQALDGTLAGVTCPLWKESLPLVDLAREALERYHAGEARDLIASGYGYLGAFQNVMAIFEVVRAAVEEVGAENFSAEAFNNAAINYKPPQGGIWEGIPQWGFSETRRYAFDNVKIWEWDAETEDFLLRSDWFAIE